MSGGLVHERWHGVHAITITPFTDDGGAVDHAALERHIATLVAQGVTIIVAGGNTSEYQSLTAAERRDALTSIVSAAGRQAAVIAGVGASSPEVVSEAIEAQRLGAEAVMVHTPSQPFITSRGWLRYHEELAMRIDVPVVPYLRAPAIPPPVVAQLATQPFVAALKYAVPDPLAFAAAVSLAPDATAWICGLAETWAAQFWISGAVGFTSGLANVRPRISLALASALDGLRIADARRIWAATRPFEQLRARDSGGFNVAVVKAAMRAMGQPVGPVRPPASDLPAEFEADLRAALDALEVGAPRP